jgi:hypothetical protein
MALACVDADAALGSAMGEASGAADRGSWGVCALSAAAARAGQLARALILAPNALAWPDGDGGGVDDEQSALLRQTSLEVWVAAGFQGATDGTRHALFCVEADRLQFVLLRGPLVLQSRSLAGDQLTTSRSAAEGPLWIGSELDDADQEILRDSMHAGHGQTRRRS